MAAPNQEDQGIVRSKRDEAAAEAAEAAEASRQSTAPAPSYATTGDANAPPLPPPAAQVEALPAYEPVAAEQPTETAALGSQSSQAPNQHGPTISDPFNFPSDAPLPPYSPPTDRKRRYIVVPQVAPDPAAAFLPVYSPRLTAHGITEETWLAFLNTLSAFLTAKVSDRAIAHAGDVAREVGQDTVRPFKQVVSHTKHVGRHIGNTAKRGNVVGAFFGAVGGAISIPVSAAMGLVGATLSLPGRAVAAAARSPQTQRERADAYLAVANRDWFAARGLEAIIEDTAELDKRLSGGERIADLFGLPQARKAADAHDQIKVLAGRVAEMEVWATAPKIEVSQANLWVVLVEKEGDEPSL